jgi:hypothetical protein
MVPAVRAFVDYLVEVLDEDKHQQQECPLQSEIAPLLEQHRKARDEERREARRTGQNEAGMTRPISRSKIETA